MITHLREHPDSVLASALDSPLNLTLIRDTFPDPAEVDELLAPCWFGARGEVEGILMDRIVPVVYHPLSGERPAALAAEQARQTLGYLATRMNDRATRDLVWWRMHHCVSPAPRVLACGLLGLAARGLIGTLVFGSAGQYAVEGMTGSRFGLVYGSGNGSAVRLVGGLASEFREPDPRRVGRRRSWLLGSARFDLAVGLLVGLVIGIAVGNQSHYAFGFNPADTIRPFYFYTGASRVRNTVKGSRRILRVSTVFALGLHFRLGLLDRRVDQGQHNLGNADRHSYEFNRDIKMYLHLEAKKVGFGFDLATARIGSMTDSVTSCFKGSARTHLRLRGAVRP